MLIKFIKLDRGGYSVAVDIKPTRLTLGVCGVAMISRKFAFLSVLAYETPSAIVRRFDRTFRNKANV